MFHVRLPLANQNDFHHIHFKCQFSKFDVIVINRNFLSMGKWSRKKKTKQNKVHTFLTVFKLWTTRAFIIRIRSLAISFLRTLCVTLSTHRRVAYYCNGVWHWHIKRLHLSARTRFRLASMCACMCRLFILLFIFVFVIVIFLKFKRHVDMIMSLKICNIFIYEHPHTYIWQQPIPCLPLSLSLCLSLFPSIACMQWLTRRSSH